MSVSMASPARRYSSTSADEVGRARQRRVGAALVGAQRRDRGADLIEARASDGLGIDERALRLVDVAPQHVPGAGHVEHHGGERVAGQVVQLTRDPTALLGHGLLGERLAGRFELVDQLAMAVAGARPRTKREQRRRAPGRPPDLGVGTPGGGDEPRSHGRRRRR